MKPVPDSKPFQFRLWHLFALVTGTAVVFSLIWLREESNRRLWCESNLRVIGLALRNYHCNYRRFPPPYVTNAQGKPLYSWRVLILPWTGELELYKQWRLDEPWDSPHNQSLREPGFRYPLYECPVARRNRSGGYADYLAVVGPGMAWEAGKSLSEGDFADTTRNTIMVVEVRGSPIHWAEPVDLDGTASLKINARQGLSIGSHDPGGANVLFADASIVHLSDTTSEEEIRALLTRDGGEAVDLLRESVRR